VPFGAWFGACLNLVHLCPWDLHRCYVSSCGSIDSFGVVVVCRRHGNPQGYHLPRKAGGSSLSIIQIWALSKRKGVGCVG
jgi:hypothetical protein